MRLTQREIESHRAALSTWHSPSDMSAYADGVINQLGDRDFFNQPGLEFVREAWIAGQFGEMRKAGSVRLLLEDRPDLALRFSDRRVETYELVEADIPRKRG